MALTEFKALVHDMSGYSPYILADLADCGSPDGHDSHGAAFLAQVRDSLVEYLEVIVTEQSDPEDAAFQVRVLEEGSALHEIADDAPSVYTHQMWAQFADLSAYLEDPTDLGFQGDDMTKGAAICLYMIAERLVNALVERAREAIGADKANAEDEDEEEEL
jgi:hypothetical protein